MNIVLLAPHNDDEALFASIICLRWKPLVIVVTDSFRQFTPFGITANQRRAESEEAAKVLGVEVEFLGVADNSLNIFQDGVASVVRARADLVFAPALQGGHGDHDTMHKIARASGRRVIYYATYGKPVDGFVKLVPTPKERNLKLQALDCYKSQHPIMEAMFRWVYVEPAEWISEEP